MKQGMKESYRKGVANHPDPELCAGHRKRASEVLTGAQAGRKSSCEITFNPGCRRCPLVRKATFRKTLCESCGNPAQSETPGMLGSFMRENREAPVTPAVRAGGGPVEESQKLHDPHARCWGIGQTSSTNEMPEQGSGGKSQKLRRRAWREGV